MEITIKVNPDGTLSIGGPIENKVLCLGIIELAKKAIIDHNPSVIAIAPASSLSGALTRNES